MDIMELGAIEEIDPERSSEFAQFLDTAFASVVRVPGYTQWWDQFKGIFRQMSPSYYARIESADPPNLLEFMPWFALEDAELEEA